MEGYEVGNHGIFDLNKAFFADVDDGEMRWDATRLEAQRRRRGWKDQRPGGSTRRENSSRRIRMRGSNLILMSRNRQGEEEVKGSEVRIPKDRMPPEAARPVILEVENGYWAIGNPFLNIQPRFRSRSGKT
uniref:Uncharacterized protein n=1 Tax=Caenorhabditis tropicalis TaxID=1561998 RepID=A0A1I7TGY9_9PELO